jgi:PAS domain S-box-containing protein
VNDFNKAALEERVVVLAATARDAELTRSLLAEAGMGCTVCGSLGEVHEEFERGAGAILLPEEALAAAECAEFANALRGQPVWSDVPVLLLTGRGADSLAAGRAIGMLPNVTVLERPVRIVTLVSAMRTALNARRRQYALRTYIAAQEASERRQAFLLILSDSLRCLADPVAIQEVASRLLGEQLCASRVHYAEVTEDGAYVIVHADYRNGVPSVAGQHRLDGYGLLVMNEFRTGRTLIVSDVQNDLRLSEAEKQRTAALEAIAAYIVVPLMKESRVEALLVAHHAQPHEWTAEEIGLAKETAERTWSVVERARAEAALRESEERLRIAADAAGFGIYDVDMNRGVVYWSPELLSILGLPPDTAPPSPGELPDCIHPDDRDKVRSAIKASFDRQGPGTFEDEHRVVRPDGAVRWVLLKGSTHFAGEGEQRRAVRATGIITDITERKRTEDALWQSEATFRAMFSVSSVGLAQADSTTARFLRVNAAMCRITGYDEVELLERSIFDITHPDDRARDREQRRRVNSGEADGYELDKRYLRKDGSEVWIHVTVNVIRDNQGRALRNTAVIQDITQRKHAEEALRESEAQLRLLTETLPVYILRIGPDLRYRFVNRAYAQRFGFEPRDLIGKHLPDVVGEKAYLAAKPYLDRMLAGEEVHYEAVIPYDKLGTRFMRSANVVDRDETGKLRSVIGVLVDLTDRKQAEDALKEADRRKDEFLATLAHELRNPLAPIRNAVQIIKAKKPSDPDLLLSRDIIDRQVAQMARLLDDLLDVSRITRNRLELRKQRVSLASVAESAVETSRPLIEGAGHRLSIDLPAQAVYLDADPVRLAQVFSNLLNNAAKYTPDGGRIELKAQEQGPEVVVSVKDTGIGLTPEMLPRLFEMFSQAKPALERAQGGLGIGLSLVKGLVEMHGGRVDARSEGRGRGSEFIVRLPVVEQARAAHTGHPAEQQRQPQVEKRRILIVDDLKDAVDSLSMLLRAMGHEIHTAYDGEDAVAVAQKQRPDAVLLDLGMPRLNGYDACRRIRAQRWGKEMFIVAVTGWGQEEDRRRSREAGFDDHLVKPVDTVALMKVLASLPSGRARDLTEH